MHIYAHHTIVFRKQNLKQPKCLATAKRLKKLLCVYRQQDVT